MTKKVTLDPTKIEFDGHGFKAVQGPDFDDKIEKLRQEVLELEKQQDDSTDIYKLAARVKNLARVGDPSRGVGSLTPAGESLCNLYVHVLKSLYSFSETLESPKREELYNLVRSHEGMPGELLKLMKPKK
jgi:hypothetical protein